MAPHSASRSAPTTPQSHGSNPRTPSSTSKYKPVSLINRLVTPSPCSGQAPSSSSSSTSSDHPVEAIARIREHPEGSDRLSLLQVIQSGQTVRIRTEQGYRDFGLDGVSLAENEDLPSFYKKYVESRIELVKSGGRCTIMMYGPTGAGKSHTMFGSVKEPGIAYRALQNILGGNDGSSVKLSEKGGSGSPDYATKVINVVVTILEIYNEEIFDLLAASNIPSGHWTRPNLPRARVEIMGKKVKNAVSITGMDAEKISKEIAKVEKRRVIKSTLCNERSSRSHCVVMLDVPSLGGRLVLVDMAGSENLEQAGLGMDSKLQTGKINQSNIALKRVVEAIANGDSYIPFRDSKLTMLLQDSFEDDESKILMILCASPDPKDIHKTIGTLEYGCKAKCIVALPASPAKERSNGHDSALARVQAMDVHISKLEAENHSKDKEKEEMYKELKQKEEDLAALQQALEQMEHEAKEKCSTCCNEDLRVEMENRIKECQRAAEEFVEMERKKLEEKVAEQQREIDCMQSRMKEIEREVELFLNTMPVLSKALSKARNEDGGDIVGKVRVVLDCINMVKNEEQSKQAGLSSSFKNTLKTNDEDTNSNASALSNQSEGIHSNHCIEMNSSLTSKLYNMECQEDLYANGQGCYEQNGWLPIIPEEESEGEEEMMADDIGESQRLSPENTGHDDVCLTIQEGLYDTRTADNEAPHEVSMDMDESHSEGDVNDRDSSNGVCASAQSAPSSCGNTREPKRVCPSMSAASRRTRIENIFLLCGNHRELAAATNTQKRSHESDGDGIGHSSQVSESPLLHVDHHQVVSHSADTGGGGACSLLAPASSPATTRTSPITPKETPDKRVAKGGDKSPARFLSLKSRHTFSENTPPRGTTSAYSSPISPFPSHHSKSIPAPPNPAADSVHSASKGLDEHNERNSSSVALSNSDLWDVYVKWETSKDSSGKLIGILKMRRHSTLAELRAELESRQASDVMTDYSFLLLGDPSGNPVERENEARLLLTCLPDCHKQKGTKLACLRPHLKHTPISTQSPLCSRENQMAWNSPKQTIVAPATPSFQKSPLGFSALRPSATSAAEHLKQKTTQRLSLPLVSQIKGLRL